MNTNTGTRYTCAYSCDDCWRACYSDSVAFSTTLFSSLSSCQYHLVITPQPQHGQQPRCMQAQGGAGRTLFHEVGKGHLGHRPVAAQRTNQLHQLQHRPDGVCLGAPAPLQVLPCRRMRLASGQNLASSRPQRTDRHSDRALHSRQAMQLACAEHPHSSSQGKVPITRAGKAEGIRSSPVILSFSALPEAPLRSCDSQAPLGSWPGRLGRAPVRSPCDRGECATTVTFRSAQRCSSPLFSGALSSRLYLTCASRSVSAARLSGRTRVVLCAVPAGTQTVALWNRCLACHRF